VSHPAQARFLAFFCRNVINSPQLPIDNISFMEYIPFMEWTVLLDDDFALWLSDQPYAVRVGIAAHIGLLAKFGPALGRPQVDTLQGTSLPNLKELRVQIQGDPWRVLFVFDPKRRAIVLVGGNKRGDKRWYKQNIPLAEARYQRHLQQLENETNDKDL